MVRARKIASINQSKEDVMAGGSFWIPVAQFEKYSTDSLDQADQDKYIMVTQVGRDESSNNTFKTDLFPGSKPFAITSRDAYEVCRSEVDASLRLGSINPPTSDPCKSNHQMPPQDEGPGPSTREPSKSAPTTVEAQHSEVVPKADLVAAQAQISFLEARIKVLEGELFKAKLSAGGKRKAPAESKTPAAKKAKQQDKENTPPPASTFDKKTTQMAKKKLQQGIKAGLKGVKFFSGYDRTYRDITVTDFMTLAEFEAVFGEHGALLQPTATNKPGSKVHIRSFTGGQLKEALGLASDQGFKAELWRKGGKPGGGFSLFGGVGGFSKGSKVKGGCQAYITQGEANFSAAGNKLRLKVTLVNTEHAGAPTMFGGAFGGMDDEGDY